ncbi:hypothetical protein FRC09_014475, partial [Ceratobasidium sp. 395]
MINYLQHVRKLSTSTTPQPPVSSRTRPYIQALERLSARTRTPLPSLIVSFGILHELTAIVPLVGLFFCARGLGAGEKLVGMFDREEMKDGTWVGERMKMWVEEGEAWAGRVGRRYGVFGFQKGEGGKDTEDTAPVRLAGDVANAVLAYGIVK